MVLGGEDSTGSGRTEIWAIAVRLLRDYGVFGAGHSNFPIVYRGYDAAATVDTVAHNIYLGVWVELGIIGLVLLLGCFVVHLLHSRRVRQAVGVGVLASAIQAACIAALLAAAFIDVTWKKWFWLPWVLAAWAATLAESSRSVRATPTPASTGLPATTHGR
jgi:O-antigen ligase